MPSPCQGIQDQINTIEVQIEDLQNLIDDPDIPSSIRATALRQLATDRQQLVRLQAELRICQDPCSPIEAKIQADESQITSLTAQINATNTQIQFLTTQIAGLNAQLTAVQSDLQQQQQALAQCQAAHP